MDWVIRSCNSWVATAIDVGLAKEDHRAAVVHVRCTMRPQGLHRRPHMRKLASLHVDADSIAAIAKPAWKFDVHSHAAMIQQGIQTPAGKLLCQRQPGSLSKKRKPVATCCMTTPRSRERPCLRPGLHAGSMSSITAEVDHLAIAFDQLLTEQDKLVAVCRSCIP